MSNRLAVPFNLVSLRRKFQRSLKREGLFGTIRLMLVNLAAAPAALFRKPGPPTWFDAKYGVDTDRWAALSEFAIDSPNYAYGQEYAPITVQVFEEAMSRIDVDHPQFTFVDLGSGKGRALLLAAALPFRRIIGVEFIEPLHRIALENLRIYNGPRICQDIQSVCMDATQFSLPNEPLVILLFNPFVGPTMLQVLRNIEESLHACARPVYILYVKPIMTSPFRDSRYLEEIAAHEYYHIFTSL